MPETWLANNARVLRLGMILPGATAALGLVLASGFFGRYSSGWLLGAGGTVFGVSLWLLASLANQLLRPRLGYQNGQLLLYVRRGAPVRVPIEQVECFLLGQGPTLLPGEQFARTETSTIVVRLSERDESLARRPVDPMLAAWCDYFVTLRGTWCEPISLRVVNRLNERLARAQSAVRSAGSESTP
jgi:hypothetical protein